MQRRLSSLTKLVGLKECLRNSFIFVCSGIFRMSESSSDELSTPELLRAAFAAGGKVADDVIGNWVPGDDGCSFQIKEDGTLFCWVEAEETIYQVMSDGKWKSVNSDEPVSLRLTLLPEDEKQRLGDDDFVALAENRNPGFAAFSSKWEIPANNLRHLLKFDSQFVSFVISHFDPKKAKPKNALQKFTEALAKFPQRWRVQAIAESSVQLKSITTNSDPVTIGSEESCEFVIPDVPEEVLDVFTIENDFFAQVKSGAVSVDGLRVVAEDGPVQLHDGAIIKIHAHSIFVEIGSDKLLSTRIEKSAEPPVKRLCVET